MSDTEKDELVKSLRAQVEKLERKDKLKSAVYPHNAFIQDDTITFCYDESQRKPLGRADKMVFAIKSIPLYKYKAFLKANARDLHLHPWICGEHGEGEGGHYSNTIDESLYNQCFTIRLSECLHRMIEQDNALKLSLLKKEYKDFHDNNR